MLKEENREYFTTIFLTVFKRISFDLRFTGIEDAAKKNEALNILDYMTDLPEVVDYMVSSNIFLDKVKCSNGLNLQALTIFGTALTISTLPNESTVPQKYFTGIERK